MAFHILAFFFIFIYVFFHQKKKRANILAGDLCWVDTEWPYRDEVLALKSKLN